MPIAFVGPLAYLAVAPCCFFIQDLVRRDVPGEVHGVNLQYIDHKTSPTIDFYRFSNGSWLDHAQIPEDQPAISATAMARQRNEEMMWKIIVPTLSDLTAKPGTPEQLVGEFVRTGMNRDLADRLRFKPIESELRRIAAIQTRGDLVAEFARLHRWQIDVGFRARVDFDYSNSSHKILKLDQAGLSLFGKDRYISDDSAAHNLRVKLRRCIKQTFMLLGDAPDLAENSAKSILSIETLLANAWKPESDTGGIEGNFHPMRLSSLAELAPHVDWTRYLEALGAPNTEVINVGQPGYLGAFSDLLQIGSISDWRAYLRWHLVEASAPFLSTPFVEQNFALNAALTGQESMRSREEMVLEEADASLGSELGQLLAKTKYAMSARPKVLSMVKNIRAAIREKIQSLEWMATKTKARAIEKLERMAVEVCYPEHWRDSTKLVISDDSFLENVFRAREYDFQRRLDSMARPVDRSDWPLRAYAVDARYDPSLNAIILPAGVLQAPYFDERADDAFNYGSLGTVIGHEMTHAFDGRGRKFDAEGNLNNWWEASDVIRFDDQEKRFIEQYDGYVLPCKVCVNGKLTLEENIADFGGLTASLAAFKKSPEYATARTVGGYTPDQRFFLAFGQLFRAKCRPEYERFAAESDPHSPPEYRVRGVLQNVPEFWKAFDGVTPKTFLHIW